jgi:NAD-dependent dihydropyrimidine dehydrogenase PreA subunit
MGLFIEVQVASEAAADPEVAAKIAEACPVDIFEIGADGGLEIVEENLDECTLCALCLGVKPGAVKVLKLYDEGRELAPPA